MAKVTCKDKKGKKCRAEHKNTSVPIGKRGTPKPFNKTRSEAQKDADKAACRSGFKKACERPQPIKRMSSRANRARRKRRR